MESLVSPHEERVVRSSGGLPSTAYFRRRCLSNYPIDLPSPKDSDITGQNPVPLHRPGQFRIATCHDAAKSREYRIIERFLQQTPDSEMFREDIVYIKFQAYLILLLKNWETGMKARCRFMSHSLKKYPRLKEISEVKRFTKLIHLYSFSSILGKLYMKYYIRKGKIRI